MSAGSAFRLLGKIGGIVMALACAACCIAFSLMIASHDGEASDPAWWKFVQPLFEVFQVVIAWVLAWFAWDETREVVAEARRSLQPKSNPDT